MSCCSSRPVQRRRSAIAKPAADNGSGGVAAGALGAPPVAKAAVPKVGAAAGSDDAVVAKGAARSNSRELKRVRATIKVKATTSSSPGATAQRADVVQEAVVAVRDATPNTHSLPPVPRSAVLTKDALIDQLQSQQTPSWMNSQPSTPQSVRSMVQESPLATPQSAPPPPAAVLKTPDWLAVLKSQGLAAGSVTDSMRQPVQEPPASANKPAQETDKFIAEETEESEESASEEEQEWHSVREIPPEHLSPAAPPAVDKGTMLCKIDVEFNTKFGDWNSTNQGKLYAQLIAAGTDEMFAKKVVMAMKENKGKVSVRGPMVNHGPAYTVFRSIPALNVGLQTPSKVDQSARRHGKAAPPPLRTAGPCAVTRLPGQPKPKQKSEKKAKETAPAKAGGLLRRNKKGMPIVKARVISPPRGSVARASSTSSDGTQPPAPLTRDTVKPISAARSLFDRNGRPRGAPGFVETPVGRSTSNSSVCTPGSDQLGTPKIGVRALRSPARLVAESFQRGVQLQGREFKVLAEVTVTKLVTPSSSEVAKLQPGTLVTAIDNQWWHGPRIKLQLPGADGTTGWASLCSTHGDYMLIPVVDVVTAEQMEQQESENAAPFSDIAPGLGGGLTRHKTARRALGLVQDENGVQQGALSTPQAIATKQRTNSRPVSLRVTPGREGEI
eukprot:COSAG02_NODE_1240_length_13709_cov_14.174798_6_plen_669_part_00